jgi:phosphoesterase RecJ-like protein
MDLTPNLRKAADAIAGAKSLAISCHVSPDGDALGSALALAHAARRAGREAVVSFGEPFRVPGTLQFLDTTPLVPPSAFPSAPECMVVFDAGSADRLGELAASAAAAKVLVVVDHHKSTTGEFGDILVVDPNAAASGQLTVALLDSLGWEIDAVTAQCLMTAIVTDTGRFQYSATSGEVLRVAGRLVDAGVHPEVIGQAVYESVPFGYLQVASVMLGRARLEADLGLVWSWVEEADVAASNAAWADLDGLIDDLRIAREAGVAALLKETSQGWKVSLRSRGAVDVGAIAEANRGGGHHNAAGFTMVGELDAVLAVIRKALRG